MRRVTDGAGSRVMTTTVMPRSSLSMQSNRIVSTDWVLSITGGSVGEQYPRRAHDRAGDGAALLPATRQFCWAAARPVGQAGPLPSAKR